MAGSEMITIDELIVAIRMPSVVLDRATHLYGVCRLPVAVVAVVMRVLEAVRLVRFYELSSHRRYSDHHRVAARSVRPADSAAIAVAAPLFRRWRRYRRRVGQRTLNSAHLEQGRAWPPARAVR